MGRGRERGRRSLHTRLPEPRAHRLRDLLARELALSDRHHDLLRARVALDLRRVLAQRVARVGEAAFFGADARLHEVRLVEGVVREREDVVEVRERGGVAAGGVVGCGALVEEQVFRRALCFSLWSVSWTNCRRARDEAVDETGKVPHTCVRRRCERHASRAVLV